MRHLLQWLYPGLAVKRWMLLFSLGILLLVFGATLILNYRSSVSWKRKCCASPFR